MQGGSGVFELPAEKEQSRGEQERNEDVEAIEENQFGIFRQVPDLRVIRREVATARDPADVRPPESVHMGRVGILWFIGMLVVVAVVIRPPQGPALDAGGAEQRQEELAQPRGAVGFMGEIPVVKSGDREHPDKIERRRNGCGEPACANPNDSKAAEMKENKGQAANQVDPIRLAADDIRRVG